MAIVRLQGDKEKKQGIYYEFDNSSKPLGEGGMGKVFRGRRINTFTHETRDVAIKFMFAGLPPNVIQRAEDEANICIQHENLVEMMGFLAVESTLPNGMKTMRYHVISELLIGVSLSDLIQGTVTDQMGQVIPYAQKLYNMYNQSPEEFAVLVVKKILSGILALHDAGYIHRDIDPSNIMITRDGKIKLIDFGIAKKVDGLRTHDRNLTTAGQFMGKPQYAAPELIIGDLKNQNKPTDIYAVGILLFQLVVGHLPFEGPSNVVLNAHLHQKMPLSQVKNRELRKIIDRATQKDCTKRYQTAAEFRAALDNFGYGGGGSGIGDIITDHIKLIGGIAAGVVVVLVVVLIVALSGGKSDSTAATADSTQTTEATASTGKTLNINDIRQELLNPTEAKKGYDDLQKLAQSENPRDKANAQYHISRLYAVSSGSFTVDNEFATMQANLKGVVSQNPAKAHEMLKEVIKTEPKYFPALFDLGCDYYEGPALTGGEERDLIKAKEYFDKAFKYASEAQDPAYINKISAMLRKY